jgi:Transmembrane secretion effector
MVTFVAIPYQVFQLTRSPLAVGLLGLVELLALLLTALVGGALADARDRRSMVRATELALAVLSAVLAVNSAMNRPGVGVLFAVAAAIAALEGLQRPSLDALLPRLVPREELTAAAALGALQNGAAMIGGPALGGLLIAAAGLPVAYAVDVASFAIALLLLWRMRAVPPPTEAERPSLRGVLDGLRYARGRPELLGTYLVDLAAMVFGMPMALFPAVAARYGGPGVLGLLYAAPSAGALLANAISGWTARVRRHGLAILVAAGAWGVGVAGFGVASRLWLALTLLAAAGAADMVSGLFRMTIWNQTVPDRLRGRLAGIELLSYASGPALGNLESGAAAALVGVRASVVSGGLLCVAAVALLALAMPGFRTYEVDAAGQGPGAEQLAAMAH